MKYLQYYCGQQLRVWGCMNGSEFKIFNILCNNYFPKMDLQLCVQLVMLGVEGNGYNYTAQLIRH